MFNYFISICILASLISLNALAVTPIINGSDMPGALINRQRQAEIYDQKAPWLNKPLNSQDLEQGKDNIYYDEEYLDDLEIYTEGNIIENQNEYTE